MTYYLIHSTIKSVQLPHVLRQLSWQKPPILFRVQVHPECGVAGAHIVHSTEGTAHETGSSSPDGRSSSGGCECASSEMPGLTDRVC